VAVNVDAVIGEAVGAGALAISVAAPRVDVQVGLA
jgi:hypothetical protein